jgi:hypothetical protein
VETPLLADPPNDANSWAVETPPRGC